MWLFFKQGACFYSGGCSPVDITCCSASQEIHSKSRRTEGSPEDGTGHIDMFVKLLDDSTVLITETSDFPYKKTCEKAVKYFQSIKAPNLLTSIAFKNANSPNLIFGLRIVATIRSSES